ncbi:hypothetical protein CDL12_09691 [Handroanthus impetiginosus]|uniref:Uncharacterized protein n=1 Tax=Handroanthus impetiginosus TaxID=429701 RepID=A0A2G9HJF3_9LAMI|nr:hypothetical protein CDL12_09691 [Handroanthus impetiginosus]
MDSGATVKEGLLEERQHQKESFMKDFGLRNRRSYIWKLSGPAILAYMICQYSLGAITQTLTGQVGELELAAVSLEDSLIVGLLSGAMLVYTYKDRGLILLVTTCVLLPIYIFAPPILMFP